jgi:hypothetical protein
MAQAAEEELPWLALGAQRARVSGRTCELGSTIALVCLAWHEDRREVSHRVDAGRIEDAQVVLIAIRIRHP